MRYGICCRCCNNFVVRRKRLALALLVATTLTFVWLARLSRMELRDLASALKGGGDFSCRVSRDCPPNATCVGFATAAFGSFDYWQFALQKDRAAKCSQGCQLVSDPAQAHGLLFHAFDLPSRRRLRHLRSSAPPDQRWIFYSLESPVHLVTNRCVRSCQFALPLLGSALALAKEFVFPSYLLRHYPDTTEEAKFFNWTVTYRRDSTVYAPYARFGVVDGTNHSPERLMKALPTVSISFKKYLSFIVVSNCHPYNQRQEVLMQLARHMQLHVYGSCGDRRVPDGMQISDLSRLYYFYISFENAFCTDYITEKFFANGLGGHSVPVAFGGNSRRDYEAVAPPKSFVYAGDFSSAAGLAEHLKQLASSPAQYARYHEWRRTYRQIDTGGSDKLNLFCQLCRKLKATSTGPSRGSTSPLDLNKFYNSGAECRQPDFNPFVGGRGAS